MQILAEAEDLPKTAQVKTQLVSLWTVPAFVLIYVIAFFAFRGFTPPLSPAMTAEQVAAFYAENTAAVRFSMVTYRPLRHHADPVLHGDRRADEADGHPEPRLRVLLS